MLRLINKVRSKTKQIVVKQFGAITGVHTDKKVAALSFDDGPHPVYTPELLRVLKVHKAKGTFFIIGKNAQKYPHLLRTIASEGHAVGNHSFDHASFTFISFGERRRQIRLCRNAIKPFDSGLFRPPYGNLDILTHIGLRVSGYRIIMWNSIVQDWIEQSSTTIYDKLNRRLKPGCIILLHDNLYTAERKTCFDRAQMLNALDKFLSANAIYEFMTVPELLKEGPAIARFWRQKGDLAYDRRLIRSS
jgi:peptidoglycan/xylan/chitin deacetylase (PgdA/CDA1 family)